MLQSPDFAGSRALRDDRRPTVDEACRRRSCAGASRLSGCSCLFIGSEAWRASSRPSAGSVSGGGAEGSESRSDRSAPLGSHSRCLLYGRRSTRTWAGTRSARASLMTRLWSTFTALGARLDRGARRPSPADDVRRGVPRHGRADAMFQEKLLADYVEHPGTIPLGVIWHGRRTSIDPRRFVDARLVRHAARRNGG